MTAHRPLPRTTPGRRLRAGRAGGGRQACLAVIPDRAKDHLRTWLKCRTMQAMHSLLATTLALDCIDERTRAAQARRDASPEPASRPDRPRRRPATALLRLSRARS